MGLKTRQATRVSRERERFIERKLSVIYVMQALYRKGFRVRRSRRGPTRDPVLVVSMRLHQICPGWGYLVSRTTACASGRTGAGSGRLHRRLPAKRQGGGDSHRYVLWFGGGPGQSACGRADLRDQDPAQAQATVSSDRKRGP